MPEGHTLHRLAQALDSAFTGTVPLVSSPQGRFEAGAALLSGRQVLRATAWGKHLFVEFAGDQWLNVHLGLIGRFSVERLARDTTGYGVVPPVWGQVRLRLLTDEYVADLRGATVCTVVTPPEVEAIESRLGPDPLQPDHPLSDPDRAWTKLARSGRTVAEMLMDQSVLAGVGNVYRSEVLFRNRVSPFRPGKEIRRRTFDALWGDLVRLMPLGVAFNQIITMEDQVELAGALLADGQVPQLVSVFTDSARRVAPGPAGVVARRDLDTDTSRGLGLDTDPDTGRRTDPDTDTDLQSDPDTDTEPDPDTRQGELDELDALDEPEIVGDGPGPAGMPRRFYVYRRQGEPCRHCGSKVRTKVVAGRNLFWCGRDQRRR